MSTTTTKTKVEVKFSKYENVLKAFITAKNNTLTPEDVESASESSRTASKVISSLKTKYSAVVATKKKGNKITAYVLTNADKLKTTVVTDFETKRTATAKKELERQTQKASKSDFTPLPIEGKPLVNPYKSTNHTIQLKEITPEEAHEILSWYNDNNRPLTKGRVATYVQAIESGKWGFNGAPIRFKQDGSLLDGQHRLNAVYKSGVTQKFAIVGGLDDYAFTTMDYGKTRNGADVLYIAEKGNSDDPNPKNLVGLTKVINSALQWVEAYNIVLSKDKPEALSRATTKNYDILDVLKNHRPLIESAKYVKSLDLNKKGAVQLGLNEGQVAFIHYEISKIDNTLATEFLNQVCRGIGVAENSVADVLRQFLIKNKQEKKSYKEGELLRRVIIAWDRLIKGDTLTSKSLQSNSQKLYPTFSTK